LSDSDIVGSITGLWRYPVKSLRGERLKRARLDDDGIQGDREWAIESVASGRILSAKRYGSLLMAEAATRTDGETLLTLPNGTRLTAGTEACDAALSEWLEQPVRLVRRESGRRAVFDAVDISDNQSQDFEIETQPGLFMDTKSPLHILTSASLASIAGLIPGIDWSVDRFRPNLLIETATTPGYPEDTWINRTIDIAGISVWIRREATRCIVPTLAQPGLLEDRRILRALIDERANSLGVRAHPISHGTIEIGARVALREGLGPPRHLQHLERAAP
jgi:MOSC domain-containing protein